VYLLLATAKTGRRTVHVGIAKDVQRRMLDHKTGRVKATRGRRIQWLGNTGPMLHGAALHLESMVKKKGREQKLGWLSSLPYQVQSIAQQE